MNKEYKAKMKKVGIILLGLMASIGVRAAESNGDIVLETSAMRLVIGADACAKSLIIKANGEECLDTHEGIPLFSTTQDRPYNNEIKLTYPNCQTTYPANRCAAKATSW